MNVPGVQTDALLTDSFYYIIGPAILYMIKLI